MRELIWDTDRREIKAEVNKETKEFITERYSLVKERIEAVTWEKNLDDAFHSYFHKTAGFLLKLTEEWDFVGSAACEKASLQELREHNHALYAPALPDAYEESFLNPAFAVKKLGETYGRLLSFLACELFAAIPCVFERDLSGLTIRMELFVEIYNAFYYSWEEERALPEKEAIRDILYWFVSDYQDEACEQRVGEQLGIIKGVADSVVRGSDLCDLRYLYRYGEYITEEEERLAAFLNGLPEDEIRRIADTFTEGYRDRKSVV